MKNTATPKILLAFYKGKGKIGDRLIRFWTRSPFSHVEIILDNNAYAATQWNNSVRKSPYPAHAFLNNPNWSVLPIHSVDFYFAYQRTIKQLGKKYDWLGIFLSQILPLRLHHKKKWFCSELAAHVIGLPSPQKYSPGKLFNHINSNPITKK